MIWQMKFLKEMIENLEKKLEEKSSKDNLSEMERAKRDVKDEATKGDKVDIYLLHEKLIVLENISRQINKGHEKMSLIISRSHTHKPAFAAALVLKLLCNKEEEAILDKEQRLMKSCKSSVTPLQNVPPQHMSAPPFSIWFDG